MEVSIDLVDAGALIDAFNRAPELANRELTAAMWEAELLLTREIKERTPTSTNVLRGSITAFEPQVLADRVIGVVGTSAPHAVPVELGTKPHFPPLQPLRDWVKQNLDVPLNQIDSVAFLIGRAIAKRGTKGAHMFGSTFEEYRPRVEAIFDRARRRIAEGLRGS